MPLRHGPGKTTYAMPTPARAEKRPPIPPPAPAKPQPRRMRTIAAPPPLSPAAVWALAVLTNYRIAGYSISPEALRFVLFTVECGGELRSVETYGHALRVVLGGDIPVIQESILNRAGFRWEPESRTRPFPRYPAVLAGWFYPRRHRT